MSRMKREGFAVHDVAATVGGGFYLERPLLSWGRLQGHRGGAVWECGTNGDGGGPGERPQCREFSAAREFSTAPMPPRFAAFVADGIPQVRVSDSAVLLFRRRQEIKARLVLVETLNIGAGYPKRASRGS